MTFFPLFHNTQQLNALLIGGGNMAKRRAKSLIDAGVACDLMATKIAEDVLQLIESAGGKVTVGAYVSDDVIHDLIQQQIQQKDQQYLVL